MQPRITIAWRLADAAVVPVHGVCWSIRMLIDSARPEDIPQMVQLLMDLFSIEQDFVFDSAKQESALVRLLTENRACVLVARDSSGRAVGMVTAQLVISTAEGSFSAWIEDLVVHQDHRRQGAGRALLTAALRWAQAQGATRAQLLVDTDNTPAIAWYDALSWQTTHLNARRMQLR